MVTWLACGEDEVQTQKGNKASRAKLQNQTGSTLRQVWIGPNQVYFVLFSSSLSFWNYSKLCLTWNIPVEPFLSKHVSSIKYILKVMLVSLLSTTMIPNRHYLLSSDSACCPIPLSVSESDLSRCLMQVASSLSSYVWHLSLSVVSSFIHVAVCVNIAFSYKAQ